MSEFGEPWTLLPYDTIGDGDEPLNPSDGRRVLDAKGLVVFIANDASPRYENDRRRARRIIRCVNFLAGVPDDALHGPVVRSDAVHLALAVLRAPDDLGPLAALVDACLDRLGGTPAAACDYCSAAGPRIRGLCEQCIRAGVRPGLVPT